MGIELPAPFGEAAASTSSSNEKAPVYGGVEQAGSYANVEVSATERPAYQEVKSGSGGGTAPVIARQSVVTQTTDGATSAAVSLDDIPVVAADEDLIEKVWVDSVKRVIKDTRDDPYRQSEAISRLQADYLQKRYGRTAGGSGA